MAIMHPRAIAYAEAITNIRSYTKHSKKGKAFRVRQHERNYNAVDERGNSVEVHEDAHGVIDKYLSGEHSIQDLIDGYMLNRDDYKVGNIEINVDEERHPGVLTVSGLVMDEKGTAVGDFSRTFNFDDMSVSHDEFVISESHRGKGIATDLNTNAFDMYRKLGMTSVSTYADGGRGLDGVGRYAWAMQGFDFARDQQKDIIKAAFSQYLKEKGYNDIADAVMKMEHSWEIASTTVNGEKIGKEFMIKIGPNWSGVMNLGDGQLSSKVFDVYAKNSKGKDRK